MPALAQALGVSKHVVYLRKETIPALLTSSPLLRKYVDRGQLLVVMWEDWPLHSRFPRKYDQHIGYSHAMLALTGLDVYLLMLDLDDYLVGVQEGRGGAACWVEG